MGLFGLKVSSSMLIIYEFVLNLVDNGLIFIYKF